MKTVIVRTSTTNKNRYIFETTISKPYSVVNNIATYRDTLTHIATIDMLTKEHAEFIRSYLEMMINGNEKE